MPLALRRIRFLTLNWIILSILLLLSLPVPFCCAQAQELPQASSVVAVDPELERDITALPFRFHASTISPEVISPPAPRKPLKRLTGKYDLDKIGARGIGKGVNFYSLESERRSGSQLADDFLKVSRQITDPALTEYVNRITQNMGLKSDVKAPLTIHILDQDEVNAFSLPGGFLFVSAGLMREADTEAELVAVIAHETGHVAARHATREISKGVIWSIVLSAAAASVSNRAGRIGAQVGSIVGTEMIVAKLSRNAEDEADLLAIEYLYAAGYDPQEYVRLFEKIQALEKKKPSALGKMFRSHPDTKSRILHIQRIMDDSFPPRPSYLVTTSDFQNAQERLEMLLGRRKSLAETQQTGPVLRKTKPDDNTPPQK